jgi:hypothetical protein
MPIATDAGLVCTNVRSMDGKRPVFIDASRSTFFFPYHILRFLEIPEGAMAAHEPGGRYDPGAYGSSSADEADRNGHAGGAETGSLVPIAVGAGDTGNPGDPDDEIEIDEEFLQRIRDI